MSVQELMNDPEANKVGWVVVITTWLMGVWNWVSENGNEVIVVITGLLGIIFLILRIKLTFKEYKIKSKELEKLEKDED